MKDLFKTRFQWLEKLVEYWFIRVGWFMAVGVGIVLIILLLYEIGIIPNK